MSPKAAPYITCLRYRQRPRKHIAVCRGCKWRRTCRNYRKYLQPELPFDDRRG